MNQQFIASVTAEAPALLTIVWGSGKQTKVDLSDYLHSPGYERLKKTSFFAGVAVEEWGTVSSPSGDLPQNLFWNPL